MQATIVQPETLTEDQFASISHMVRKFSGINLHAGKVALVRARLQKRLRLLGLHNFGQYVDRISRDGTGREMGKMLEALSTNLTFFFREKQHLKFLLQHVLSLGRKMRQSERRLRIWSAGCSSGEEPYSIAMTLKAGIPDLASWDLGILATDLSGPMIRAGREGVYPEQRLRETPAALVRKNFTVINDDKKRWYRVRNDVRRMVHFAQLNLMAPWPMTRAFDVIFCRNVMIYFDKAAQDRLVERFWQQLTPGGMLFIGHSESLTGIRHRFHYVQPSAYEKM